MALVYTTWADWVRRAGTETRLKQFAVGDTDADHPRVDMAEATAVDEMNSYLRKRGYQLPLDAPLHPVVQDHLLSIGMQWLTIRSDTPQPTIDKAAEAARTFFQNIARGLATLGDDVALNTPGGQLSGTDVIFSRQTKVMDSDDPQSELAIRNPRL